MNIDLKQGSLASEKADVIIITKFEDCENLNQTAKSVDEALSGLVSEYIIKEQGFEGKFGEAFVIPTYGKIEAKKVLLLGLGKEKKFSLSKLRYLGAKIVKKIKNLNKIKTIATKLSSYQNPDWDSYEVAKRLTEGIILGKYSFDKYKTQNKKSFELETINIIENDSKKANDAKKGIERGQTIGNATNWTRDLINEPACEVTPEKLAKLASGIKNLEVRIIDQEEAKRLGMGAFLAVSRGSSQSPYFIHMKYKPANKRKSIALIGKGLTFDSGGLNLKPPASMANMKDDMSGAACVLSVMETISRLKPDVEVHGIIAATENMPGCSAYKPGDVVRAMNGKTIEIDNTDAEGRLTLADALCYAVELNVDEIIDIATLTGACMVALGAMASGIFGNNQDLIDRLVETADESGERFWQLPMYKEYFNDLKSDIADFKNAGSRYAGASSAALFLKEFVDNTPWAHIDIAGTAIISSDIREISKGATGVGVRTLLNYILD